MAEQLVAKIRPGSIIILHDDICHNILPNGEHNRKAMLAALNTALERLQHRFEFVTVPELLRQGRVVRDNWYGRGPSELRPRLERYLSEYRRRERLYGRIQ
jgi:hypothetical protein